MVCETDKISGIAGAVADAKAQIKKEEADKVTQNNVCNSAFDFYEQAYSAYRTADSQAHFSNLTKQEMQKKLDNLKIEMKLKIAEASKNGKNSAEISALQIYYEDLIGNLEATIASFDKENKKANLALVDAERTKQNSKFSWISATSWFQQICQTLFGDYLSLGNMERSAYLEQLALHKQASIPDNATKSFMA